MFLSNWNILNVPYSLVNDCTVYASCQDYAPNTRTVLISTEEVVNQNVIATVTLNLNSTSGGTYDIVGVGSGQNITGSVYWNNELVSGGKSMINEYSAITV